MSNSYRTAPQMLLRGDILLALCAALSFAQAPTDASPPLPLHPTRTVTFTTDEGSWLSLDVSPDGKTIVFDMVGRLYTLPIDGGTAAAITTGLEFDAQPRYSPDGKHIVFVSDRSGDNNLWICNPQGGELKALSHEQHTLFTSPIWTPNGRYVLVSRKKPDHYGSAFELWEYDPNGGSGVQVVKSKSSEASPASDWHNALGVTASPDDRYLYYATRKGTWASEKIPSWQIARFDTRTAEEDLITSAEGSAFRPQLSRDGSKLIYGTRYDAQTALRIRDIKTGSDRWLKYPVQHDDQEGSMSSRDLLPGYAFLPDGNEIVLSYGGRIHRVNVATGADQVIPFSVKISRGLGPKLDANYRVDQGPVRSRLIQGSAISPNGRSLAFSAFMHIYRTELPNAKPRRLTDSSEFEFQPSWSPDGKWLAYVTWTNERGALWKMSASGGAPQRLTEDLARYSQPVWTPDASHIIALRTDRYEAMTQVDQWGRDMDRAELVSIPANGGQSNRICDAVGFNGPHFAKDPDRLYVTWKISSGPLNAEYKLISLRLDGSDRRTLFTLKGKDVWGAELSAPAQIELNPEGTRALALYRAQIYLLDVPQTGGEMQTFDLSAPSAGLAKLTRIGADQVQWADDGKTLAWTTGASVFKLPADSPSIAWSGEADKKEKAQAPIAQEIKIDVEAPRDTPKGSLLLRGATVITMHGDEVLPAADVLVTDNRIAAVGRRGSVKIPAGVKTIDVTGKTIVPGFVDTHDHWTRIRRGILDPQNWDFLATLAFGVTTGRDPQTFTPDMFAYQDLADAGEILGPRAYSTGPGVFFTTDFQSEQEAEDVLSRYKNYYRTWLIKAYMVGDRRQRDYVVEAYEKLGLLPTTEGFADMSLDLTHVIDGFSGIEHQFPIFPLYKDVVQLTAQSQVFYTPTYVIDYGTPASENRFFETTDVHDNPVVRRFVPHQFLDQRTTQLTWYRKDEYTYPEAAASAAAILRAGGKVCVGGHGEFPGLSFHWEMWSLQQGGMTNMEALRAATLNGAEAIGLAQDLGSLEHGKLADLVVLNKSPLSDIRATTDIRYVMKNGRLYDAKTLDELWPRQKKTGPFWWWSDYPPGATSIGSNIEPSHSTAQ